MKCTFLSRYLSATISVCNSPLPHSPTPPPHHLYLSLSACHNVSEYFHVKLMLFLFLLLFVVFCMCSCLPPPPFPAYSFHSPLNNNKPCPLPLYAVTDSYTCSGWQTHCAYVTLYRGKLFLLLLLLLLLFVIVVWLYGIIVLPGLWGLWGTGVVRFRHPPSLPSYPLLTFSRLMS